MARNSKISDELDGYDNNQSSESVSVRENTAGADSEIEFKNTRNETINFSTRERNYTVGPGERFKIPAKEVKSKLFQDIKSNFGEVEKKYTGEI